MAERADTLTDSQKTFGVVLLRGLEYDLARYREAKAAGPEALAALKAEYLSRGNDG